VRAVRRSGAVLALAVALLAAAQPADAAVGDLGHDVSSPQCGGTMPASGVFGIVGVTAGLPFSVNPCLATEAAWAVGTGEAMLYTNTANPGPTSQNWPDAGTGRCLVDTSATDPGCAYEYGRKAAGDALAKATSALAGVLDPTTVTWWLDVEGQRAPSDFGNSWEDDQPANAATVQGFVDGLRQGAVPEVGVYSTAWQWNDITGGYTRARNASYRSAWGFSALYPIEDGPVWFAGLGTLDEAAAECGTASFTGGQRLLAQYQDVTASGTFDGDGRCADPDLVAPTAAMTAPTSAVTLGSAFTGAWTGSDTGGSGLATFDLRQRRISVGGSYSAWSSIGPLTRTAARSSSLGASSQGWTTCLAVRSRDAAGNLSAWSGDRCTAVPLDDRSLSASTGWTRATASGWFASTYSSTTRLNATLSRSGLVTSRLSLVAQRCSTCGKVAVYLGSSRLAVVDLYSSSTSRVVIPLPRFSLRTATVTVKVVSSGKPVRIDGLASSRV